MKNKIFLLLATSLLLVGCGTKKQSTIDDKPADDPTQDPVDPIDPVDPPAPEWPEGAKHLTLTFLNNADFGTGKLTDSSPKAKFIEAFNKEVNILSDITVTGYVQMVNNSSSQCYINNTLLFGSRTSEGSIKFNFNYNVVGLNINAQPYWTCYNSAGELNYSVDQYADLYVQDNNNGVDFGTVELGKEPNKVDKVFKFASEGTNKVTIFNEFNNDDVPENQSQRSYIHSMEIIYIE